MPASTAEPTIAVAFTLFELETIGRALAARASMVEDTPERTIARRLRIAREALDHERAAAKIRQQLA